MEALQELLGDPKQLEAAQAAVARVFGPAVAPGGRLDNFDRFLAKSDHQFPALSYLVAQKPVKICERNPDRLRVMIFNYGAQTAVDNSAVGAAGAIAATLPAVPGVTNYITGFEVKGSGATAASAIIVTVTGVPGGPLNYEMLIPAGAGLEVVPLIVEFPVPIPATGPNVAITVSVPTFGAGNLSATVDAHGYTLGQPIFLGHGQVTAGGAPGDPNAGWPILPGTYQVFDAMLNELWAISGSGNQDVRVVDLTRPY